MLGYKSVLLVDSCVLLFLWVMSEEKMVETGCSKLAQEIWPCYVGPEGQGASSLVLVGSLTCWLLVGDAQDWWWAGPCHKVGI